jgi:hypothetical protein
MFNVDRFARDISNSYQRHIIDADKQSQALVLASFLVTFLTVRLITHAIRAGRWRRVLRNVQTEGGTHIHHLVPGILLLLSGGYIAIALAPGHPREAVAVPFGVGAALTLDEFALWLHLEDCYWTRQGRQSVDAVVVAATLAGMAVIGHEFWSGLGRALGRFFTG